MSLLEHTPTFSADQVVKLAREYYALEATAKPLPSERDQNFVLQTPAGERFVLKIANALEELAFLEAQNRAMIHLKDLGVCPEVIVAATGQTVFQIEAESEMRHWVRLISYLPGVPLGEVKRRSAGLLSHLGETLGKANRSLLDFDHPALHREFHWDLARGLEVVRTYKHLVTEPSLHQLIEQLYARFEHDLAPRLPRLRRSAIHSDVNDYNLLVGGGPDPYSKNQRVSGLIDFGDMVYSYTVCELAIAIAYAVLDQDDPLSTAAHIVRGYHSENPLSEVEIEALLDLICLRLCVSACMAARQQSQRPDDAYLGISQQPIRRTLPRLAQIRPGFALAVFHQACGLPPVRHGQAIQDWLKAHADSFASVVDVDLRTEPVEVLDLSVSSPLIYGDTSENTEPKLTRRVFDPMESKGVAVSVGRYLEPRLIYTEPMFATGPTLADERRTVHLGIDLFAPAGTAVYAPLEGTVHAFANNTAHQDYGPVIVLKHQADNLVFFTLYGHLSLESLEGLQVGQHIGKGQRIATIGEPAVNGGWTPHLHFQILTDDLGLGCDFPGVGRFSQLEVWQSLCPDPNIILGIPADRFPVAEPAKAETLRTRRERIGRNLSIGYREPIKAVRGWMQYLFDETGRKYLDAYNNVPQVGHAHPRVVKAAQQQMALLSTNTRYLHDTINRYAEELCATLPAPLSVCFFVNSASEANELALRLVRAHTRAKDMIVLEAAYHGHTNALIDISPYKHAGKGGMGAPDWVHTVPIPDVYRGQYKQDDTQAGLKYAAFVQKVIADLQNNGRSLGGFIAETCPSVGGQIFLPEGYMAEVYRLVRQAGGLCIADEVQTGYGRIGTHFWAFEAHGVVPDMVVMGKPIGNGYPLGAVVTTPEIAASFDNGMEFFSTFGGSTVSCAVGLEVLRITREEQLQAHALRVGERLLQGLKALKDKYPVVGDVRGSGLFLGVELVRDRQTLEPADAEASFVANRMREQGILLGTDGPFHNVVKIRPPMPFDEDNSEVLVETLGKILQQDFQKLTLS